jgi:hypothetical protein
MSRFWQIDIGLDNTYSKDEQTAVIVASRSMIHFVERRLYPLNFRSDFYRLLIHCTKGDVEREFYKVTDPPIATVNICLDLGEFLNSEDSLQNAFMKIIQAGINKALQYELLPIKEIIYALQLFKKNGYVSKWTHIDKEWKRKGLRCVIEGDHKTDTFDLTQKIFKNGNLCKDKLIAKIKPREGLFYPFLGKATLKDNQIIYSNKGYIISTYNIETNKLEFPDTNIKI